MTPLTPRTHRRKRGPELLDMAAETAVVLGCILSAIIVVWWAA
ncbi:hypothetical protein R4P64_32905 [Rhodococcus sp. IEGM 1366]|nr:hypothetical protein [Rhodococcus sp. IEGM 1366]MDV8071314.1 hypothetical protein [Rhodococcus sp. IEGM 1366]